MNMSDFNAFTQIQSTLEAIPEKDIHVPDMPVEIAAKEAEVMVTAAREDLTALTAIGLNPDVLDSLALSIGALRYAHAHHIATIGELKESAQAWRKHKSVVQNLHRKLLAAWAFATRDVGDASLAIKRIRKGKSRTHLIHHLMALAELGEKYPEARDAIHLKAEELQSAKTLAETLCSIEAKATTESSSSKSKEWRDRAFTHMRSIMKTIVPAAEYAFLDNSDRMTFYRSAYRRRFYLRKLSKKSSFAEVLPAVTAK